MASLSLSSARLEQRGGGSVLATEGDWKPSAEMLEALDHGIALTLAVRLQAQRLGWFGWRAADAPIERHLELRYFPLTRRYQLRDVEQGVVHSYGIRAAAVAAFGHLELPLAAQSDCTPLRDPAREREATRRYRLRVDFDAAALPGALRLPALLLPAWRQNEAEWTWLCAPIS